MEFEILRMLLRRITMIHRYRQILFYTVLVFLFMLTFSMLTEVDDSETHAIEQRSDTSWKDDEELESEGSGNGEGFHYDRVSDQVTGDDPEMTDDDDSDHDTGDDGLTPVRLDTRGPSHGFWPEDAQCSRHR